MSRTHRPLTGARHLAVLAVVPVSLLLTACGGDAGSTTAQPSAAASGAPGGPGGGLDLQAIQECLTAAGIEVPTPNGTPPSGAPDGTPPSGAPGDGRGGGPGGGMFQSEEVQAALKACGITGPTGGPRPSTTPTIS
jgi:hypothetical protein